MATTSKKTTTATATAVKKPVVKKSVAATPAVKKTTATAKPVVKIPTATPKVTTAKIAKTVAAPAAPKAAPKAAKAATTKKSTPSSGTPKIAISAEHRYHMIATAAYFLAERREFSGGYEMQDWISAEANIDSKLKA